MDDTAINIKQTEELMKSLELFSKLTKERKDYINAFMAGIIFGLPENNTKNTQEKL